MGKSVFLATNARGMISGIQIERLRAELGRFSLSLDGPFSDKGGAVAELARTIQAGYDSGDVPSIVKASLLPQNSLPPDAPWSERSVLDVPFIVRRLPKCGWQDYPESAGAVAGAPAVEFNGGLARDVGAAELTILAVSVLRTLGVACHFSLAHCPISQCEALLGPGTYVVPATVPSIILPMGNDLGRMSLISDHTGLFSTFEPAFVEVLDNEAVLSSIRLRNAMEHAKTLMADLAKHEPLFPGEAELRCRQVGHMLHDAMSLWALSEAQKDSALAITLCRLAGIKSYRETKGEPIIANMTDPRRHIHVASSVMLCEELGQMMDASPDTDAAQGVVEFMCATLRHGCCMPQFNEYISRWIPMINGHLHPVSECRDCDGGKADETGGPGKGGRPGKAVH
jgi:hypothetical protein